MYVLVAYWSPGHRRRKWLVTISTDGRKIFGVSHVRQRQARRWVVGGSRFGTGGGGRRGLAPGCVTDYELGWILGLAFGVAVFAWGVHVMID